MNKLSLLAAAKLNLYLEVGDLIGDFHDLKTIYTSIDLYDRLDFEIIKLSEEQDENIQINIIESRQSLLMPQIKDNLVYKAVNLFFAENNFKLNNYKIIVNIEKKIPISAGMAGGSANAAATLFALNCFFENKMSEENILALCAGLGSDIPFCYLGGLMLGIGKGDKLTRINTILNYFFLIVFPPQYLELKTKLVYKTFDNISIKRKPEISIEKFMELILAGHSVSEYIFNSLEEAAIQLSYWIDNVKSIIDSKGFKSLVSGSGGTVFTMSEDKRLIENLKAQLVKEGFEVSIHKAIPSSVIIN